MSPAAGARTRTATTLVALAALLLGTLVAVALPLSLPAVASEVQGTYSPRDDRAIDTDLSPVSDGTVRGTVRGPEGELLDDVLVEVFSALDPGGDPVASDLTYEVVGLAPHGAYRLRVPAGDYLVRFSSPIGATNALEPAYYGEGAGTTVTVAAGQDLLLAQITLRHYSGAPVTGRVVDVDGRPVADESVSLVSLLPDGEAVQRDAARTNGDGRYRFDRVPRGQRFTISTSFEEYDTRPTIWLGNTPSSHTATTFTMSAQATGLDLAELVLSPGVSITGRLEAPEENVYQADVALIYLDSPDGRPDSVDRTPWASHWEEETFRFTALPGRYTIGVLAYDAHGDRAWTYLGDTRDLSSALSFTVADTPLDIGKIVLRATTSTVTFRVADHEGRPADTATLAARLLDRTGHVVDWADHRPDGRFYARVPRAQEFTVRVDDKDTGEWRFLGDTTSFAEASFLSTTPQDPTIDAGVVSFQFPAPTAPGPIVRGTPRVGQQLTVDLPSWTVTGVVSRVQWLRDGLPIETAKLAWYQLTGADMGHEVSVRVTGSTPGHAPGVVTSPGLLIQPGAAPTATTPTLEGIPRNGMLLSVPSPEWSLPEVSSTYQWLRDGQPLLGATTDSYLLRFHDIGHRISVRITGRRTWHDSGTVTSAAVPVGLGDPPPILYRGYIRGSSDPLGGIVRVSPTIWPSGVTETLQWYADGHRIPGATGTTLRLGPRLTRTTLTVVSTATRAGSAPATSTTAPFRVGFAAPRIRLTARGSTVTLRVSAPGGLPTTGRVVVHHDRRIVARTMLTARQRGVATLDLARLGRGRHTVRVSYGGNDLVGGTGGRPLKVNIE